MDDHEKFAQELLALCQAKGLKIATAESCTGGMIAAALTDIAGSSATFERGFVTYSNEAKMELLGVKPATLAEFGAVSQPIAGEMADGALAKSYADISVSVTGIAGPGGATAGKPVGLVWFGLARKGAQTKTVRHVFEGDRAMVRKAALKTALALLSESAAGPNEFKLQAGCK